MRIERAVPRPRFPTDLAGFNRELGMRANVFGIDFDPIDQSTLIAELVKRARVGNPSYVVTIDLHHVLLLWRDHSLRSILADPAAFLVPDGRPLLWMRSLRGVSMQL